MSTQPELAASSVVSCKEAEPTSQENFQLAGDMAIPNQPAGLVSNSQFHLVQFHNLGIISKRLSAGTELNHT